jgi:hypothetical protein
LKNDWAAGTGNIFFTDYNMAMIKPNGIGKESKEYAHELYPYHHVYDWNFEFSAIICTGKGRTSHEKHI